MRHAGAGYEIAKECAREMGVEVVDGVMSAYDPERT
jgi:hypothetical protein